MIFSPFSFCRIYSILGAVPMRNLESSPTREASSVKEGTACSPGHPSSPGRAARGKSGASPRRCPRARPGPGAPGGGRARPGLREAPSRAPSACQNRGLRSGTRPPRRSLPPAPGERPLWTLPPATLLRQGWGAERDTPALTSGCSSAGLGGRRRARRGGGAAAAPAPAVTGGAAAGGGCAPRPPPGPSRAGPAAPRPPADGGCGGVGGRGRRGLLRCSPTPAP